MDKERALDIVKVHACCTFVNVNNKLCEKCPWNETDDCENTAINEAVIIEAMNVLRGE